MGQTISQIVTLPGASPPHQSRIPFPALHDARYPVHRIADRVEPYLRLIVERFKPKRIILFGSQVYGTPRWDSDVDVLVIRDDMTSENEGTKEILRALWGVTAPGLSFTILARTSARIADRLAVRSPFYEDIISKGLEVYAA